MKKLLQNREDWLRRAYNLARREVLPEAPEKAAISWSFPSRGGTRLRKRTIGECHYKGGTVGGKVEGDRVVLVSPTLTTPFAMVEVLLHEMVHAALPPGAGHRAPFSRLAKRIGLRKPWTATSADEDLTKHINRWLRSKLPKWPGGFLVVTDKQKTRQLKATCDCDPARILRASAKTFEQGPILCGVCDGEFELNV